MTPDPAALASFINQRKQARDSYVRQVKAKIGAKCFDFLRSETQSLLINSEIVSSLLRTTPFTPDLSLIDDYSFAVFPAARAYEGFLKQLAESVPFIVRKKDTSEVPITREILETQPDFGIGIIFNERSNPKIIGALRDKARYKNYPNLMKAAWDLCRCDILHYDYKKPIERKYNQFGQDLDLIHRAIRCGFEGYLDSPEYTAEELLKMLKIPKPKLA